MFERSIINHLRSWKEKSDRKPLVIRGPRQVGKTTAIKMFAREFKVFIHLNLERIEERSIFETDYSFRDLLASLFLYAGKKRESKDILLFIDEIQNSPRAISLLRYFYEEAKDIFVIAAGSLLESILDRQISFPVGRIEFLAMHPCTFQEFLGAMNEEQSLDFYNQEEIPEFAHEKLTSLFKKYTTIGGMPEIIQKFSEKDDYTSLVAVYDHLMISYIEDVEKYARSSAMAHYIRHIISAAFRESGSRITFEKFGNSDYRSREMKEAFNTLEKTMLLTLVYPVTSTRLPLIPDLKKKPRLQIFDTGLVNYSLGTMGEIISSKNIDDLYRGRIAEHIVGQELKGNFTRLLQKLEFWTREKTASSAEVDYITVFDDLVIPIEVKAGSSGKLRSLHQFIDKAPHPWAVRFYSGKRKIEDAQTIAGTNFKLINLPHYMAGRLDKELKRIIR